MWRYDRPSKEGYHYCTLMAKTGDKTVVYGDKRDFRTVDTLFDSYRMFGEPLTGLGWVKDADGYKNEKVIAWSENETNGVCDKLPKGAIVVKAMDLGE